MDYLDKANGTCQSRCPVNIYTYFKTFIILKLSIYSKQFSTINQASATMYLVSLPSVINNT